MKSQRGSSREDARKKPETIASALLKRVGKTMTVTPSVSSKIVILGSQRLKVDPIRIPIQSQQHSRKTSISSGRMMASGRGQEHIRPKSKDHCRNSSTISKRTSKVESNFFKIDVSKILARDQQKQKEPSCQQEVSRLLFDYHYVVGKGGFGKVWCVEFKRNRKLYAMKEMQKAKIVAKKSIHSVLNERDLLSRLKHPFLVNMNYAFQDRQSLYLVMDLLVGGDLRYHMGCRRRFKETESKFFIACILSGLEFLHLNGIIHRDIKPQNLVFDEKGYLRVTDLGIARIVKPNNNADTSGTPGYMAPEVMCRQDHSYPVDFYALGIIAYELMMGRRPYKGNNRKEIRDDILARNVQIRSDDVPSGWSPKAAHFVTSLIQRKPCDRLGTEGGVEEIKSHPWFEGFSWQQLAKKIMPSPFVTPNILNSSEYRQQISSTSEDENEQENQLLLRNKNVEEMFQGYSYYSRETPVPKKSGRRMKDKRMSSNVPTTSATLNTYTEDRQSLKIKPKVNNYCL